MMTLNVGDIFHIDINQGAREAVVVARDGDKFLYEYEMPNGTTALRNQNDRPVSYKKLSDKWVKLIDEQYGILNLVCYPQQTARPNEVQAALVARAEKLRGEE